MVYRQLGVKPLPGPETTIYIVVGEIGIRIVAKTKRFILEYGFENDAIFSRARFVNDLAAG